MRNRCAQSAYTRRVFFVADFLNKIFKRIAANQREQRRKYKMAATTQQKQMVYKSNVPHKHKQISKKWDNWLENLCVNKTGGGERRNSRFGSRRQIRLARREERCRVDEKQVKLGLFFYKQGKKQKVGKDKMMGRNGKVVDFSIVIAFRCHYWMQT